MADVLVAGKQIQFTLSLGQNGVEETTRTLTIDVPSGTDSTVAKTRATTFKTEYMRSYNDPTSLLQATGWRDSDEEEDALVCLGITAKFIDKSETYFDI